MKFFIRLAFLAAVIAGVIKLREWYSGAAAPQSDPQTAQETVQLSSAATQLTRELSNSLVFVEGQSGVGSGFVCAFGNEKFVVTNQHVIAGNSGTKFTLLDRSPIRTGQVAAAVGHDIMSFALLSDAKAIEIMTDVEQNASIGDEVAVLGNANGDRVIKPIAGKLVGIGPDRVEITAEFVHGNSGSPIIHVKSGKALGIATYATIQRADSITGKPKAEPEVKRFGYRLDSVKQWQPVVWPSYMADFNTLEKVKARTDDFVKLLRTGRFISTDYSDPAIRNPLERFANAAQGKGLIKTDRLTAAKDLTNSLRTACDTDIAQAQTQVKYDFFRHRLEEHQQLRKELRKGFDDLMKRLPK